MHQALCGYEFGQALHDVGHPEFSKAYYKTHKNQSCLECHVLNERAMANPNWLPENFKKWKPKIKRPATGVLNESKAKRPRGSQEESHGEVGSEVAIPEEAFTEEASKASTSEAVASRITRAQRAAPIIGKALRKRKF